MSEEARHYLFAPAVAGHEGAVLILCPVCGREAMDYAHPGTPVLIDRGDYQNGWGGRGRLIVIPFEGECGHTWEVCFGFHKGCTSLFARADLVTLVPPGSVATIDPLQWTDPRPIPAR
jgi:hypothetical protein